MVLQLGQLMVVIIVVGVIIRLLSKACSKYGFGKAKNRYHGERDRRTGKMHGRGTLWAQNGDVYTGTFFQGLFHGRGEYRFSAEQGGGVYRGEFRHGRYHGQGEETYPDGSFYKGEFLEGERHGKGRMVYSNGNIYKGDWNRGKKHGKGVYTMEGGRKYSGQFQDGKMSGKGDLQVGKDRRLVGDFAANQPEKVAEIRHSQNIANA